MKVDLSQFVGKDVKVTYKNGVERFGKVEVRDFESNCDPLYPYLVFGYSYNVNGQWKLNPYGSSTVIHIELLKPNLKPNPMTKYEQLQIEINELKALREKEDAKIKELEKEIESLKEEDMKNRLPKNFDRKAALHCIKTKNRLELALLDWRSTPQGIDYWADIYHNRAPFTNAAIMQLQEWVILSYQQEFEGK